MQDAAPQDLFIFGVMRYVAHTAKHNPGMGYFETNRSTVRVSGFLFPFWFFKASFEAGSYLKARRQ